MEDSIAYAVIAQLTTLVTFALIILKQVQTIGLLRARIKYLEYKLRVPTVIPV